MIKSKQWDLNFDDVILGDSNKATKKGSNLDISFFEIERG